MRTGREQRFRREGERFSRAPGVAFAMAGMILTSVTGRWTSQRHNEPQIDHYLNFGIHPTIVHGIPKIPEVSFAPLLQNQMNQCTGRWRTNCSASLESYRYAWLFWAMFVCLHSGTACQCGSGLKR